jgi:hypothetical protein
MASAFIRPADPGWECFDISLPAMLLRVASGRAFDGVPSDEEILGLRLR